MNEKIFESRSLAQMLAIQSQIQLPGTVGRILNQIRELETVAPMFVEAGLVKGLDRPTPLNLKVSGIGTRSTVKKTIGGFLYASAAVRIDLKIEKNVVSTAGQDSLCEIDDINFEDQSKILQLNETRLAYRLAESALETFHPDIVLMDCPLALNRSMVPSFSKGTGSEYHRSYGQAVEVIQSFWETQRESLFPWNSEGAVLGGIAAQRFGAIVHSALADLREVEGRKQVLSTEKVSPKALTALDQHTRAIMGIGERRFVFGILGSFSRTAAFRMNVHTPRMEPSLLPELGVLGVHYRANQNAGPQLLQLIGDAPGWDAAGIDLITGSVMALTATGGEKAVPFPIQLAQRELRALDYFLENYRRSIAQEMRSRRIENTWLEELDDLDEF
jgi:hypothetical protein